MLKESITHVDTKEAMPDEPPMPFDWMRFRRGRLSQVQAARITSYRR